MAPPAPSSHSSPQFVPYVKQQICENAQKQHNQRRKEEAQRTQRRIVTESGRTCSDADHEYRSDRLASYPHFPCCFRRSAQYFFILIPTARF